jgi:hypothetical protein
MGLEARSVGKFADRLGGLLLKAGREGHVDDLAAIDAQQVVMVLGEVLGELEPGEFVTGRYPPYEPGRVQVGQVPVGRAARQAGQALGDVPDAYRVARAHEQVDDGPPAAGVALVGQPQPPLGDAVQVAGRLLSRHHAPIAKPGAARPGLMLVVMVAVGGVPVTVMDVVDMITVRKRLMPAAGSVRVLVGGVGKVRQRMLVVMPVMRSVGMPFVHVIGMPLAVGARMPAAGPVLVLGVGMNVMIGSCHRSSLL